MLRTSADRSRKIREHDRLVQDRKVLVALVREGIKCGSSVRAFLAWQKRAQFILINEPAESEEGSR